MRFLLLALLVALGDVAHAQGAGCSAFDPDATYRIQNRNSSLFLRPQGGGEGAVVIQSGADLNDPIQTWSLQSAGDGQVLIVNAATEFAAATRNGSTAARAAVVQTATDAAAAGQRWAVEDGPPGFCRFRHVESGLYLRLSSDAPGAEAFVDVLTERFFSQQWVISEVGVVTKAPDPPSGERLRTLAADNWGLRIGAASRTNFWRIPDSTIYRPVFAREFNSLTPEGQTKWKALRPSPTTFEFSASDRHYAFAEANGMTVHGHTLAWHTDANPDKHPDHWLPFADPADAEGILRAHVEEVVGRYDGRTDVWDVVNEAISPSAADVVDGRAPYRESFWTEGMGIGAGGVPDFIRTAFREARAADADAILLYNEVGTITNPTGAGATEAMQATALAMVDQLQGEDVPIDGFGLQMHIVTDRWGDADQVGWVNFATDLTERGLAVYVTEMDVSLPDNTAQSLDLQAQIYAETVERFLHLPRRGDLTFWGFTDRYSWRNPDDDGRLRYPLPFDENYEPKPAYFALQRVLAGGTARETDRDGLVRFEAEDHEAQRGARTVPFARNASGQIQGYVARFGAGDYLKFARTALDGAQSVRVTYAAELPLTLEVRAGAPDGALLGTVTLAPTGGLGTYAEATASVSGAPSGVADLYVVGVGAQGEVRLDWLAFSAMSVDGEPGADATAFRVGAASPNPSAGAATVRFDLAAPADVSLALFDVLGRAVLEVPAASFGAGRDHEVRFDVSSLPAGVYVYRVTAGAEVGAGRLTVVR